MFDLHQIKAASLEEALRQMPAAAVIVEAPSGKLIFINERARQLLEQNAGWSGQPEPEEIGDFGDLSMLHTDGQSVEMEEWPLVRSIRSGEEVKDEEYYYLCADGSQLTISCDSSPIHDDEELVVAGVLIVRDVTEQKRAGEQLAYYAGLRENAHDAFIATDERLLAKAWNKGAEEMYGWTADEVLGRDVREIARTDLTDEQLAGLRRELAETDRFCAEVVAYRKDGTRFYVELTNVALRGEGGEVTGYLGIHRDITERKKTENALRESEERFRATFEQAAVGMSHTAPDGRLLRVNRKLCEILGYTREEMLGMRVQDRTHPEDLDKDLDQAGRLLAGEIETYSMEKRLLRKDDSVVWINLTISLVRDSSGEPDYFIAVCEDIDERKRAEGEIRTRARQQAVVAELGLWALANHGVQSLMDDAVALVARTLDVEFCKIVELLPGGEEVLRRAGVGFKERFAGSETVRVEDDLQVGYTLRSREPVIVEDLGAETRFDPSPLLRAHGVVSGMTVVIPGRDGPFGGMGAHTGSRRTFSEDDANFMQAVANVLAAAVEREKAEERVDEVREAERSRMARHLHDDALQDLAYAMAQAQLLRATPDAPESSRRLEQLSAALKQTEQQVRAATYDLRLGREQDRPFLELLEALVELRRDMAPASDIHLEVSDGVLSGPLGETGRELLRIVGEALTNARRHSEARNAWVVVRTSEERLWAEVSDDGRGFDRAEKPSDDRAGGTGIKSMRERARLLGGNLEIQSEPGKGTKVRLELALKRDPQGPEEKTRVLLVEDHAVVREAIASSFEREADFEVAGQASSLAEARGVLAAEHVDVAVVDLGLPDGYGGDLIKDLRAANPHAQALVLSANLDRAQTARAVENGAAGVLHKTAHLNQVVEAVRRLRAGETLMPLEDVVELLRFAGSRREQEREVHQAIASLTPREREVLHALAEGLDSAGIAERLSISVRTQRNHMSSILAKLAVHSQLQALVFALRHGLVEVR